MTVRLAKTQISLGIRPVWSESSLKKAWVLSDPLSAQRRLWSDWASSDWADAQSDLSLRWAHTHFVGFVMSFLICNQRTVSTHIDDQIWVSELLLKDWKNNDQHSNFRTHSSRKKCHWFLYSLGFETKITNEVPGKYMSIFKYKLIIDRQMCLYIFIDYRGHSPASAYDLRWQLWYLIVSNSQHKVYYLISCFIW